MNKTAVKKSACSKTEKMFAAQRSAASVTGKCDTADCKVPCCEIRIEECAEGCKIYCTRDDEVACATLQNLCRELDSSCSVQCTRKGELCCECCFDCCDCTCQMLADGVCLCCSTSDKNCLKMIQAMCRCICSCCDCGCECTVCMSGTPICTCAC